MLVMTETDANYTNEVAEYDEVLELVYEESSYQYTSIFFKDFKYLVPTLGGLVSVFKLTVVPVMFCFRK